MNESEALAIFEPFFAKFKNLPDIPIADRPLLAHYTSLENLSKIFEQEQIWFSNPLLMNDRQEMLWGLEHGHRIFHEIFSHPDFKSRPSGQDQSDMLIDRYKFFSMRFMQQYAMNVYIFCLSEHTQKDGLLSMWRAYGDKGTGAAIVFNTDFITGQTHSPLLIAKVQYASEADRTLKLREMLLTLSEYTLSRTVNMADAPYLAWAAFEVVKLYSLMSKHSGFSEELEWRIIYLPERDPSGILKKEFGYHASDKGIDPKLKFPLRPLPFEGVQAWTAQSIVNHILLGPTHQATLTEACVREMFRVLGKNDLANKITSCAIPLRAAT